MPRNLLTRHNRLQAAASAGLGKMLKEVIEANVMRLPPVFSLMLVKYDPGHCNNCISQMPGKSIGAASDLPLHI